MTMTRRTALSLAVSSACACWATAAVAQGAAAPAAAQQLDTVVVTGVRASLEKSLNLKRDAIGTRDSIVAEDIGKFPEQNIADALARIPGVEVQRDGATNEGSRIQLRGLDSQYMVTLFNGAPVRATSGGNIGSATRDFNYDIFPSELFSRVDLYKTAEAFLEEGGAAGVIDMRTPRPFDFRGRKITYSVAVTQNKSNNSNNPRGHLLYSDTFGKFGVLLQATLTQSKQATAGAASTGHFSDSRDGTSLPARWTPAPPATGTLGRQFDYDLWTNHPQANLGNLTEVQAKSAFLPRLMRSTAQLAERERQGFNASLQYKDARWNVSLDSLIARLQTENKLNAAVFNIRDSICGRRLNPPPAAGAVNPPPPPYNVCADALTRNVNTGSLNNALIPLGVAVDGNNMLSGTLGNVSYSTTSQWQLSRTKFDYHAFNAEFKATDTLTLNAQLSDNKSVAWRSNAGVSADNNFADGVSPSATGTTGFTLTPGVVNRHNITFDLSDPLFPSISSNRNLLDPALHSTFGGSGSYVVETDRQKIAKLDATWEYELFSTRGKLRAGLSRVDSTKNVDQRAGVAPVTTLTLPNGKAFTAATLAERAEYLRTLMVRNDVTEAPGSDKYPRDYLVFDVDTIKNRMNALANNRSAPRNLPASFNTVEKISAAYLQTDLEGELFGRLLRGNVGVRHVKTDVVIDNFQADGQGGFAPANRVSEYSHTMPSVSLSYDVMRTLVLRASAGKTIKRSSVSEISKTFGVRGGGGDLTVNAGNPELMPEEASSRDWAGEWYFRKGGLLALTGYDKSFTGRLRPSETIMKFNDIGLPRSLFTGNNFLVNENPDVRVFRSANAEDFKIKGLELTFQTTFDFLPAPFNGLGMYGSYAKNKTIGATRTYVTGRDANGAAIATTATVPLVPEDVYAIATYYERGPLFLRLAYNHKSEWANATEITPNGYGFQRFSNPRGYLDASFGWKFNKALELRFDAINITNTETYEFYRHIEGRFGDEKSRIEGGTKAGRGFAVSVRGSF